MNPLAITAFTATTAVGPGLSALGDALRSERSGLVPNDYTEEAVGIALPTWIGRVDAIGGGDRTPLPPRWRHLDCRNHRLAWLGLAQDGFLPAARAAVARSGAARTAVLIGTSTSTIEASERAYRSHALTGIVPSTLTGHEFHNLHATAAFVRDVVGASGPTSTVSTACSSSAKVFAQAMRMIAVGIVDTAIVGGVDSLAASTLFGFNALGLISAQPCRPFDTERDGISVGEAAGFAVVERFDETRHAACPLLIGYGESSDAHHMSSPHPDGVGARLAIEAALDSGGVAASAVDYINLHGTATMKNDAVEAALVAELFGPTTRASSTKGWTGHALGAAGVVETVVCLLALRDGFAPKTLGCMMPDPLCGPQVRTAGSPGDVQVALNQAFAFGGNNCVLAFARDASAYRHLN